MADVANMHRDYVLYVTRHSPLSLVAEVDVASSGPRPDPAEERAPMATALAGPCCSPTFVSFALIQRPRSSSSVELMPGVTHERVSEATGFSVRFDQSCSEVAAPDRETLDILRRRIDPLGLRRLEFVGSRDRGALIAEILAADRAIVETLASRT